MVVINVSILLFFIVFLFKGNHPIKLLNVEILENRQRKGIKASKEISQSQEGVALRIRMKIAPMNANQWMVKIVKLIAMKVKRRNLT